jgi:cysteine desulfurase
LIYFDNNSTTRVLGSVADAMRPFLTERYANPSSAIAHFSGLSQAIEIEKARLSKALRAERGDQFVMTSGATESNNLAIFGAAKANPQKCHVITSSVEHPSVLEAVEVLQNEGYRITILPIGTSGVVEPQTLRDSLCADTLLVSIMMANNETGVIQPLSTLTSIVKDYDPSILIHTDATQAVGKIPVDLAGGLADVDLLAFSAHKFHGPKGTGALFVRDRDTLLPILHGGGQQGGMRSGTENPAGVVGLITALTELLSARESMEGARNLRDILEAGIVRAHPGAFIVGASTERLPTTTFICIPDIDAEELVDQLATRGIAVSAGSACSYGARRPSHVAIAHGLTYEQAKSCVRLSLSIESTREEVDSFLRIFNQLDSPPANRRDTLGAAF